MNWLARLIWWRWRDKRMPRLKPWPKGRFPGIPRFAPQEVEYLGDTMEAIDERIIRLEWRVRQLELERRLEREGRRRG